MPSVGRIIHVRNPQGKCVPAIVTHVWNVEQPDYIQATAFLDGVNDHPAQTGGRPQGFYFCSSITPAAGPCGIEMEILAGGGMNPLGTPPPAENEAHKLEYPFSKWHWPQREAAPAAS